MGGRSSGWGPGRGASVRVAVPVLPARVLEAVGEVAAVLAGPGVRGGPRWSPLWSPRWSPRWSRLWSPGWCPLWSRAPERRSGQPRRLRSSRDRGRTARRWPRGTQPTGPMAMASPPSCSSAMPGRCCRLRCPGRPPGTASLVTSASRSTRAPRSPGPPVARGRTGRRGTRARGHSVAGAVRGDGGVPDGRRRAGHPRRRVVRPRARLMTGLRRRRPEECDGGRGPGHHRPQRQTHAPMTQRPPHRPERAGERASGPGPGPERQRVGGVVHEDPHAINHNSLPERD